MAASDLDVAVEGEGRPLVLVHSLLSDRTAYRPFADRIAGRRKLVLINLPGFGASPPDGASTQRSRRFWPQAEAIKAHAVRFEATGDPALSARLDRQADALYRAHVDGMPDGAWREHLGPEGALIVRELPASSLYHITLAVAELARVRRSRGFP